MRENRGRGCRKGRQWDRCRLRGRLIGTISIDDDPEVEALSCWSGGPYPGGRAVQTGSGGRISESRHCWIPLQEAMAELKSQGYKAATHISGKGQRESPAFL